MAATADFLTKARRSGGEAPVWLYDIVVPLATDTATTRTIRVANRKVVEGELWATWGTQTLATPNPGTDVPNVVIESLSADTPDGDHKLRYWRGLTANPGGSWDNGAAHSLIIGTLSSLPGSGTATVSLSSVDASASTKTQTVTVYRQRFLTSGNPAYLALVRYNSGVQRRAGTGGFAEASTFSFGIANGDGSYGQDAAGRRFKDLLHDYDFHHASVTCRIAYPGQTEADALTVFTGWIERVEITNEGLDFECRDMTGLLDECGVEINLHDFPDAPDDAIGEMIPVVFGTNACRYQPPCIYSTCSTSVSTSPAGGVTTSTEWAHRKWAIGYGPTTSTGAYIWVDGFRIDGDNLPTGTALELSTATSGTTTVTSTDYMAYRQLTTAQKSPIVGIALYLDQAVVSTSSISVTMIDRLPSTNAMAGESNYKSGGSGYIDLSTVTSPGWHVAWFSSPDNNGYSWFKVEFGYDDCKWANSGASDGKSFWENAGGRSPCNVHAYKVLQYRLNVTTTAIEGENVLLGTSTATSGMGGCVIPDDATIVVQSIDGYDGYTDPAALSKLIATNTSWGCKVPSAYLDTAAFTTASGMSHRGIMEDVCAGADALGWVAAQAKAKMFWTAGGKLKWHNHGTASPSATFTEANCRAHRVWYSETAEIIQRLILVWFFNRGVDRDGKFLRDKDNGHHDGRRRIRRRRWFRINAPDWRKRDHIHAVSAYPNSGAADDARVALSARNKAMYGPKVDTVYADLVYDATTAEALMDFLFDQGAQRRLWAEIEVPLGVGLHLELMDVVTLTHSILPSSSSSVASKNFSVREITIKPAAAGAAMTCTLLLREEL